MDWLSVFQAFINDLLRHARKYIIAAIDDILLQLTNPAQTNLSLYTKQRKANDTSLK